ncbi:MAG: type II secretion system protein [bacterium]|nr:type II secretion system protein [bacterium]
MSCKEKRERGITFIEILMASVVLAIITIGVVVMLQSAVKSWKLGQVKNILDMNASNIMLHLTRDLKKAQSDTVEIDNYPDKKNAEVQRIKFRNCFNNALYEYYVTDTNYNKIVCEINKESAPYSPICPKVKNDDIIIKSFKFKRVGNCQITLELMKYLEGIGEEKNKTHKRITTVSMKVK